MSTLSSLLPQLREVALDATGTPMAGALLYSYAAGTTTPLVTYSDSGLTTPNTNPVVANSGGLFGAIYLSNAGYKFDLQSSAAVSLFTQDGVYPASYIATNAVAPIIQTTSSVGTQNNFALTTGVSLLRCTNASLVTISGLSAGTDGQRVRIVSLGAGQVDLVHQSSSSTAANRLTNAATSGNTSLAAGSGTAEYIYDLTSTTWRLVSHEQGAWITWTPTWTGSGALTFTGVTNTSARYRLSGRSLSVNISASGTTGGTTNTTLLATLPLTFASAAQELNFARVLDGTGAQFGGIAFFSAAAATQLSFSKNDVSNIALGASASMQANGTFEVQ